MPIDSSAGVDPAEFSENTSPIAWERETCLPETGMRGPCRDLDGRVILVSGAGGDLGSAAAEACAAAGATVILLGRTVKTLETTYDRITRVHGATPFLAPFDLATAAPEEFTVLADAIATSLGVLHGILHCAAYMDFLGPLRDVTESSWRSHLDINLTGPFRLTQGLLPLLESSESGAVVFVSDSEARSQRAYWGPIAVAKAAMEAYARVLAEEHGASGRVRINVLVPGPMRSRLRRKAYPAEQQAVLPTPERLAPTIIDLLRVDSPYANGQRVLLSPKQITEENAYVRS
jgi:NAD(P)-dependent dehydrogenase (short-subunit alcohol dehydrogenase family)